MEEVDCGKTGGLKGSEKTLERIKERFFWVNLARDVKTYVKNCQKCQEVKAPKVNSKPQLIPLTPTRTLTLLTMDIAGPLPETDENYKFILVICDHFTKFIVAYALKDIFACGGCRKTRK